MNKQLFNSSGITIVSLVIGMALSTFLITAMLQVFTVVKRNYKIMQNITELHNSMRYVVTKMTNAISYAGYKNSQPNDLLFNTPAPLTIGGVTYDTAYSFLPLAIGTTVTTGPTFATQGNSAGSIRDCVGVIVAAGSNFFTQFRLDDEVPNRSGTSLRCVRLDTAGNIMADNSNYLLYDVVEAVNVLYGYDTDNYGNINYYYDTDMTLENRIRSVRITMVIRSRDEIFPQNKSQIIPYPVTNPSSSGYLTYNSKFLYKVHTFTIPLTALPIPFPS